MLKATPQAGTDLDPRLTALAEILERLAAPASSDPSLRDALTTAAELLQALNIELGRLEHRFEGLIDAVPDAVTVLARDGRILEANSAACTSFGRPREQLLQLRIFDLNPEIPHDRIERVIAEHADGVSFVHETVNTRADGSIFPVEVHSCVFLQDGEQRVMAIARDISERRDAERELRESEARFRHLLQAMDKGVVVETLDSRVLSVNPGACRILGRSEDELVDLGRTAPNWEFVDEFGNPLRRHELPSQRALRERRNIDSTTLGLFDRERNRHLWLDVTATPQFRPGDSAPFQVISTFSDITALKRDQNLFALTQELAGIGGWEWDPSEQVMYWSSAMYSLLGREDEPASSPNDLIEHVQDLDQAQVRAALAAAEANGSGFDLECRVLTRRNRPRWMRLIGEGLRRGDRIYRVAGTLQDITKDKMLEQTLRQQASTDALTGLANRDAIIERLGDAVDHAPIAGGPAVLHVDLDRFKLVNDLLGHRGGDALLRAAAQRLQQASGEQGSVARLGGDEFLVLVSAGGKPAATRVAERITGSFNHPFPHGEEEISLTTSVGVAAFPEDGATVVQLLQNADAAMSESKRRGRNTYQVFNPALARQISDRLAIEAQLRRALDIGEFSLVFQPQVDLDRGHLHAVEALLRWNNRLLGEVRPDVFIPHAESTGDIVSIGAWVIRESCRQLRRWRELGLQIERVAVNVSFRQFLSDDFETQVLAALADQDLPGDSLELEITERVVVDDASETLRTLRKLKSQGVMITIDDFGEGYSALNYLRRLPIDALKISYGFMKGVPHTAADAAICRSIIDIARSLGLQTIGEGVETGEQRRFLREHGADLAQGYLFSRPVPPNQLLVYSPPEGGQ